MNRPVPNSQDEPNDSTQDFQAEPAVDSIEESAQLEMNRINQQLPRVEGTPTLKVQSS